MIRNEQPEELEVTFWRRAIARHRLLVVAVAVLFTVVTAAVLALSPPSYTATTEVFVSGTDIAAETQFIQSQHVVDEVVKTLGYKPTVTITGTDTAAVLTVQARGSSAAEASRAADTYASTYVAWRARAADEAFGATTADLRALIARTQAELLALPRDDPEGRAPILDRDLAAYQDAMTAATSSMFGSSRPRPVVLSAATVDPASGVVDVVLFALAAGVVGLIAGVALAGIAVGLDKRSGDPGTAARLLRAPLLGTVPSVNQLVYGRPREPRRRRSNLGGEKLLVVPGSPAAEAIGLVRARLLTKDQMKLGGAVHVLGVEGTDREDAAATAINLARSCALAGTATTLVWADFRHSPQILEVLGVDVSGHGMAEIAEVHGDLAWATRTSPGDQKLSVVLPGVAPNSVVDFLSGPAIAHVLSEVAETAAVVIVHSPPLNDHPDGMLLTGDVESTVLVVSADTRRTCLDTIQADLRAAGASIDGMVFCGPQRP